MLQDSEGNDGQTADDINQAWRREVIRTFACALSGGCCLVDTLEQHHRLHLKSLIPDDPLPDPASVAPESLRWFRKVHHGPSRHGFSTRERYLGQCLHFPDGLFASQMITTVEQILDWDGASMNKDISDIASGPFFNLIDKVMEGRLLYQADTNTQPTAALPGMILGVGPRHTEVGDKIVAFAYGQERTNRINALDSTFIVRRRSLSDLRGIRDNLDVSNGACHLSPQSPQSPYLEDKKPWIPERRNASSSHNDADDPNLEYTQNCGAYELVGDCWCAGTAATLKARGLWLFEDVMHDSSIRNDHKGAHLQGQQPTMGWFTLVFC